MHVRMPASNNAGMTTEQVCFRDLAFIALLIFSLFFVEPCMGHILLDANLPRSTPEVEGVSSQGIIDFINAVEKSSCELHSMMFLRHGKVIAEGWWYPYQASLKHSLYSATKSFTSTAIGFAVSEDRLRVNDKVISFSQKSCQILLVLTWHS